MSVSSWCRTAAILPFVLLWEPTQAQERVDRGSFIMALSGDTELTRKLSVHKEPEFLKVIDLVRGADVAFTNLELLFHDFEGPAAAVGEGPYQHVDPGLARELVWAGFDMVGRANNHAGNYGVTGMQVTSRHVREAGLVDAGVGDSLAAARAAGFLDTPKGRVALISLASKFPADYAAGKPRDGIPGRPGVNPLRYTETHVVTKERFQALRETLADLRRAAEPVRPDPSAKGDVLNFLGTRFMVGDAPNIVSEANRTDAEEILSVVRDASRQAKYTIVTIHDHTSAMDRTQPAQFVIAFAHAAIDAGASVFVGHGAHQLRGVEIYKGKPILYSVGNFIYENETIDRLPEENYEQYGLGPNAHVADFMDVHYDHDRRGFPANRLNAESVVAVPEYRNGELFELRLYPISLGFGKSRTERGRPTLAEPKLADKILKDMLALSAPFGTKIDVRDGVGIVRPLVASTAHANPAAPK